MLRDNLKCFTKRVTKAKISVFDSGFLLGDGVWEGIRLHSNKLIFINKELNLLKNVVKSKKMDF